MDKLRGVYNKCTGKERFWSRVNIKSKDDCWEWQAATDKNGYGRLGYKEKSGQGAHRVSWELVNGPIPDGLWVLHKCDNTKCCNPNHLYLGTHIDNVKDVANSLLNIYPDKARLYSGEIWLIRKLKILVGYKPMSGMPMYKFSTRYVAKMFKVSQPTIRKIWNSDKFLCKEGYYI